MTMIRIHIDGNEYNVRPGRNLLHTCLSLGFDIPYFCYHPALGSVGACRQCAVKKFAGPDDKKGRIVMSCMEPVTEGLTISTDDPDVRAFRASIIESLMLNHPHDCPVCDEGGECHLQDMTVMTGHAYRRFVFKKRTHTSQYLGPFIQHEMNRCIQCYRCVRFYRDYAGGRDLNVFGSADRVFFGRYEEGQLESDFSGNLVEVCPTGVFTDKTLKDTYTRKWDLTNAPSICVSCSLGCNTIVSERYGKVRRILSRYNGSVNGYFLCDRGRFSHPSINDSGRIRDIFISRAGKERRQSVSDDEFSSYVRSAVNGKKIAGIGSPRASLESNFALETLVGKDNFYHGVPENKFNKIKQAVKILGIDEVHSASMKEIEKSDAILILGEDIITTAPMLALAVRQALRNKSMQIASKSGIPVWNDMAIRDHAQDIKSPVMIVTTSAIRSAELATETYLIPPEDISAFGSFVAAEVSGTRSGQKDKKNAYSDKARNIAEILLNASDPVIITGFMSDEGIFLQAADEILRSLSIAGKKPSLSVVFPECNSLGLGLLDGKSFQELIEDKEDIDTLIILENDLYKLADKENIDNLFNKCDKIAVLESLKNETTERADILLPAGTYAESTGTIVNNEGRAQRYYRVLPENGRIKDSWKYLSEIIRIAGKNKDLKWDHFDDVVKSLVESYPLFSGIAEIIPASDFRFFNEKIARQPLRFSGRTAMDAAVSVSEPRPPQDEDSPLAFSMEGFKGVTPSWLTPYYWSPGWNSAQAMNKYMDEPDGILKDGDPGVLLFGKRKEHMTDSNKE